MPEESHESIADVKAHLATISAATDPYLISLQSDPRKGVQRLIAQVQHRFEILAAKENAVHDRQKLERAAWDHGQQHVVGIDEVGRGPLAGPVVTCAIELPHDFSLLDVNDSKQLRAVDRERLYPQILAACVDVSIGIASPRQIDQLNIYQATRVAMRDAVLGLIHQPDLLLIDAMQIDVPIEQQKLIKGDAKSVSIGAASIVAKVYRDHLMQMYDQLYPGYGFVQNDGYGTKQHLDGLAEFGITPIHRHSFSPVAKYL
ncbi:ribonuclease HII [Furfurilactobacillus siliginis]|uniref:Ribonuclease HII n=1 Tax=Furfurilactobacillus siliginis TaxID=348151 RepID=A0A0R2LEJ9_9LACO|nr:ribonuclease HII [Furfurilactobacillus siliginis]KRN97005.1 ribonuclease H [Furfurilactobacillus siliginis]GEK27764.1 ribonuclease HII [Furfurilactobacillus siliginis]